MSSGFCRGIGAAWRVRVRSCGPIYSRAGQQRRAEDRSVATISAVVHAKRGESAPLVDPLTCARDLAGRRKRM